MFGKRLKWPDDYFQFTAELSYQRYVLSDWQYFPVTNGKCNNLSLYLTLSRSSIDNPIYPRQGSEFSLSAQITPPFSLFDGTDYSKYSTSSQEDMNKMHKWIEYHKWKFKSKVYIPLMDPITVKRTPVLMGRVEFGLLGHYNKYKKSPFETFDVGGDGMTGYSSYATESIALRGYENSSLTPYGSEGYAYTRLGLELRYPLMLETSTSIYALTFVEAGNAWHDVNKFNPFELKRSAGVGVRIFLPMIGMMGDVSRYNDGERGGMVKVRAKINKIDNKTLSIAEVPFGKTVPGVCDSIVKASEKGKIKIRKVEDLTSEKVEILVHLAPGVSSDKTLDALYAFTDCEVSISPNCCVIDEKKPHFLTVSAVLKKATDNTLSLLRQELEIHKGELLENLHFASLEKIFIEERIYKEVKFEQSENTDAACEFIDERLTPFYPQFIREVTKEDILKLLDIKMARILKFNKDKADENITRIKEQIEEINNHLAHIVEYTIDQFHDDSRPDGH